MFRSHKVHRPHNHGPRVAEALLAGVLVGLAFDLSCPLFLTSWPPPNYHPWWFWGTVLPGLMLLLAIIQRHCRHYRWRFPIGVIAVTGLICIPRFIDPFRQNVMLRNLDIEVMVLGSALFGSIAGLFNIGLVVVKDCLTERPGIQDGTLCPTCAYIIIGLPEPRCPECGNRFTSEDMETTPPSSKPQWRRFGLVSLLSLSLLVGSYFACPYIVIRGMADGWLPTGFSDMYFRINPNLSERLLCEYLENGDDDERVIGACCLGIFLANRDNRVVPNDRMRDVLIHAATKDPVEWVRRYALQSLRTCLKSPLSWG